MTAPTTSGRRAARVAPAARQRRLAQLLRTETQLLWRFGAVAATAVVTIGWIVVLRLIPTDVAASVAPVVLLTDVTALGFLFVPTMLLLERIERADVALRATPVRSEERVVARVGLLATLSAFATLVLSVAVGLSSVAPRVLGVALLAVLFGLVAFALSWASTNLGDFLFRAPFAATPLLLPALIHLADAADWPGLYVSPVTSAVDLLRGDMTVTGTFWIVIWIVGSTWLAIRAAASPDATGTGRAGRTRRLARGHVQRHPGTFRHAVAVRSFAMADRRTVVRDGMALLLLASLPLVTIVMRVVATFGVGWAQQRYGVTLEPHLPLIEALLLTIHTPVVVGALTGLLLLEDRDAGLLAPLAATRAGLTTLVVYRLGAGAAVTTVGLMALLPLDGVTHPAGLPGIAATAVAAGAVSIVPAMLMATTARNRVQGVAAMKMMGLPLYLPLATWAVVGPARWLFAPLPTSWVAWASWSDTAAGAALAALIAVLVAAAAVLPLTRRFLARATTP